MGKAPGWTPAIAFAQGTRAHGLGAGEAETRPELVKYLPQRLSWQTQAPFPRKKPCIR